MANHKSALKRIRISEKRRQRNRIVRGSTRTAIKKAKTILASKDTSGAEGAIQDAISALDRAAAKGVIHKNNAARRKSRLMRQFRRVTA